jgi:hypothetical protein
MFRYSKETVFPGNTSVRCAAYEWSPRLQHQGRFTVRFLAPLDEPRPRKFYIEPILAAWVGGKPADTFLNRLLAFGREVLLEHLAEKLGPDDAREKLYRFALSLFRQRHHRPYGIAREFGVALDFMHVQPKGMSPIIPGVETEEPLPWRAGRHQAAWRCLRDVLSTLGSTPAGRAPEEPTQERISPLRDILRALQSTGPTSPVLRSESEATAGDAGLSFGPEHEDHYLPLLEGVVGPRALDTHITINAVRSALIYLPDEIRDCEPLGRAEALRLVGKISRAALNKSPKDFDRWLANSQMHGFTKQIITSRLEIDAKRDVQHKARQFYADLLWLSYQLAARCYGAWTLLAFTDFSNSEDVGANEEERLLFRLMNHRRFCLAGLPLCFFSRFPLRWIVDDFIRLCNEGAREAAQYDVITWWLGYFGEVVRRRRAADVARKGHVQPITWNLTDEPGITASLQDEERYRVEMQDAPYLRSTSCPICGTFLKPQPPFVSLDGGHVGAEFRCSKCEECRSYRLDPIDFPQLGSETA